MAGTGPEHGESIAEPPRFCPRCRASGKGAERLCPACGESWRPQGYCATCERYWMLPPGEPCPKHELPLDAGPLRHAWEAAPGQPVDWVTLQRFPLAADAEGPRIRLEAEGIPTFLDGARMGTHGLHHAVTGGVALQVPRTLAAEARVLLDQSWSLPETESDLDDAWEDLGPDPGSTRLQIMQGVVLLLLGLIVLRWLVGLVAHLAG